MKFIVTLSTVRQCYIGWKVGYQEDAVKHVRVFKARKQW